MAHAVDTLEDLIHARHLSLGGLPSSSRAEQWNLETLSGRLTEIFSGRAPAGLTAALSLVARAQGQNERAAWITTVDTCFFPPDAAAGGVDLDTLGVIRLPEPKYIPTAADKLVRSGAFGLVVMDLTSGPSPAAARTPSSPSPRRGESRWGAGSRLAGLARKHDTAVIALTDERTSTSPLGPMVSLKGEARRTSPPAPLQPDAEEGRRGAEKIASGWGIEIRIVRDKRGASGWSHSEPCHAPAGMR